jgi:uncharacterized protein (DUF302 family)
MKRLLITFSMSFAMLGSALADNGLVTRESRYPVAVTMDRLEAAVMESSASVRIFARIDFQALSGGRISPNQALIFGSGGVLPALAAQNPAVTMDLPLKIVVWEDAAGRTWLTHSSAAYLRERHGIFGSDDAIARIGKAYGTFAEKATQ